MNPARMHEEYLKLGWHLLPLSKDKIKHAGSILGRQWQHQTSCDIEVVNKWMENEDCSFGLHLGPISNVIDVESDTDIGNERLTKAMQGIHTPCFQSKRSCHWLFAWDDNLKQFPLTSYSAHQVEYRIGGTDKLMKPKGCMSVLPPAAEREWIITPWECALAPIPDFVIEALVNEKVKKHAKPHTNRTVISRKPGSNGDNSLELARAYLLATPPAVEGQGGDNHTFKVACRLIRGFSLTSEQAWPLFQEWNDRCDPPWEESLLFRKLEQAIEFGTEEVGAKIYQEEDDDVNLTAFYNDDLEPEKKRSKAFPEICRRPPGVLSEIIEYNLETALYPQPELALAGALALFSTVTGRKIQDQNNGRANIYVLAMAPSGSGKEHSRTVNKTLLDKADLIHMQGPERIASSAGLVSWVAKSPSILFQLDEIGRMMETVSSPKAAPYLYNIVTVLMQMYSSANSNWVSEAYADTTKTKLIRQPHPVVYGTSTAQVFWGSLTRASVSDGFLGRIIAIESENEYVKKKSGKVPAVDPPEALIEKLKWWAGDKLGNLEGEYPTPIVFEFSEKAQQRFDKHIQDIEKKRAKDDEETAAVWSRSGGKVAKISLLFAASRLTFKENMEINLGDMDRAIALCNFLTRQMLDKVAVHVGENEYDHDCKRVLRSINPGGVSSREISRSCRGIRAKNRNEILEHLEEQGRVQIGIKRINDRSITWITRLY